MFSDFDQNLSTHFISLEPLSWTLKFYFVSIKLMICQYILRWGLMKDSLLGTEFGSTQMPRNVDALIQPE